jgi:glycosyltransferase involved in cell wall biosynthesis
MGRRIIFTVTNDLSFDQRMQRICSSLAAAGYEVTLVGRLKKTSKPLSSQPYQQVRLKYLLFNKGKLFYLEFNLRLLLFLLFVPCDGICSIDLDTAMPGIWVAKLRRKKHVFDAHELFTHVPEVARRAKVQAVWEWVQKYTFKHTDAAYTVGPAIAEYFGERYNTQVGVVRNMPLSTVSAEQNTNPGQAANYNHSETILTPNPFEFLRKKRFILYQGALNEGRGLEVLIKAMKEIPCELVLAGEGDLSDALRRQVVEEGLSDRVFFLGMIAPAELPLLTPLAYLGFNVSENVGLSYYLSLNNKFFDYTQSRLPSLVNPYPEYTKLLSEFQVGLPTEATVDSIVLQANRVLNDMALHGEMKAACEAAAAQWQWQKEEPALLEIYRELFAGDITHNTMTATADPSTHA